MVGSICIFTRLCPNSFGAGLSCVKADAMVFTGQFAMLRRKEARSSKLQQLFLNFLLGILLGSVVTYIGLKYLKEHTADNYVRVFRKANYLASDNEERHSSEVAMWVGEDALSNWMSSRINILCWILTSPDTLQDKAVHVKATWAKRCNTVLFISSENTDFPTIAVNVDHEHRDYLWQKTKGAFEYIYAHYLDKADWFLKADDDTYVIVENVRKLLHLYDTEKPIFFGRKFKFPHKEEVIYMQGGAGYVLSRRAVELLVEKGFKSKLYGRIMTWNPAEDVMVSMLLYEEGVEEGYSRDGIHETFHAVAPEEAIVPSMDPYTAHNFYTVKQGPECCSDYTISFHHVTNDTMQWLEYMVYDLRPFGVGYHTCPVNIRSIVGLQELPSTGSLNAIEGQNITNAENEDDSPIKKSREKAVLKRKRDPRKRRKITHHVSTEESVERLSEEKIASKKERAPRRRRKKRVKEKADVKEEEDKEKEEEEEGEEEERR